jgi:hypothetical protein
MVRPSAEPVRSSPGGSTLRRPLAAGVGILAVAVAAGLVVTHHDHAAEAPEAAAVASPSFPVWTPTTTSTSTWVPHVVPALPRPPMVLHEVSVPPPTSPPAPVPAGRGVLPVGRSVIMRGDSGEEMTLTVLDVANPAPAVDPRNPIGPRIEPRIGYRMVAVDVQIENTGGVPFIDDIEKYGSLVDRAGRTYPRNTEMTDARQLHPASRLDPDSWNGREIVFEVRGSVDLARFRLSTHPGVAGQTQDWRFG